MAELLPSRQAADLHQGLIDYLATTFELADADAQSELRDFLTHRNNGMLKGPYVRTRLPFAPANADTTRYNWWPEFAPYRHQAAAFDRLRSVGPSGAARRPQPTLVTTGTGSGKTEAFLLPILDHCRRATAAGERGIKALILYPMNALATDQADRITRTLTTRHGLSNVTAGIYIGQAEEDRTQVSERGLITSRSVLRDTPPDILLTNYKMLDQLLLRPDDAPMWALSATSLQYIVLDEFHTYDGAQGTDVAMLLRRLGLALKAAWPEDLTTVPAYLPPTDADKAWPLGKVTPVATSATLGDDPTGTAILDFAHTVFGQPFTEDALITENRITQTQWAAQFATNGDTTLLSADGATLTPQTGPIYRDPAYREAVANNCTPTQVLIAVLNALYDADRNTGSGTEVVTEPFTEPPQGHRAPGDADPAYGAALALHPLTAALLDYTRTARPVTDVAAHLFNLPPGHPDLADATSFVSDFVGALSHLRASEPTHRWPSTEAHLWVREVTRIDRLVTSTPRYHWADDGPPEELAYPAIYCRHCGRSGWGVILDPVGNGIAENKGDIRARHLRKATSGKFRPLLYAPVEASGHTSKDPTPGLMWYDSITNTLLATMPDPDDEDVRAGRILPVLTHTTSEAEKLSGNDTCPSCHTRDAISFVGSAIPTLLSVGLSTMFGAARLDDTEKKTLVFTDSVQDAAHRAGFVQARSHTMTLRSTMRRRLTEQPTPLSALAERIVAAADTPADRFLIIPPDLQDHPIFAKFWQNDRPPAKAIAAVTNRLAFDATLEFGLNTVFGRTLERTGAVAVHVTCGAGDDAAACAQAAISAVTVSPGSSHGASHDATQDGSWLHQPARQRAWVRGLLDHMRRKGAIDHPFLHTYAYEDGKRYRIWGGRNRENGVPAFPGNRSAPAFAVTAGTTSGRASALPEASLFDNALRGTGWYVKWTIKSLGVSANLAGRLVRLLLEHLHSVGTLARHRMISGLDAYAIHPDAITVAVTANATYLAGEHTLTCTVCHALATGSCTTIAELAGTTITAHSAATTPTSADHTGFPCLNPDCDGYLARHKPRANYYRDLYASTNPRRIVAHEHTSLLRDEVRTQVERDFKRGTDNPSAPNVLVATPTLEMGIDIGDLSTVVLSSLPRRTASYVQRVGRAGRLTGNALNVVFVHGSGANLPKLHNPLDTIAGAVRPPATYLSADEILQRQYVGFVADTLARTPGTPRPRTAPEVMRSADPGTYLGTIIELAHSRPDLMDDFLGSFDSLDAQTRADLRRWATPADNPDGNTTARSGLAQLITEACASWLDNRRALIDQKVQLRKVLPELKAAVGRPTATDDDRAAYNAARSAARHVSSQLTYLESEFWISQLELASVLPNYTLLGDRVDLDVAISWVNAETGDWEHSSDTYQRNSANGLREFAPGNVFYVQGLAINIDAVDLGADGDAITKRAFCPECGYNTALLTGVGGGDANQAVCPRCGATGINDTKQHLDVVEFTRASAVIKRDESRIGDHSEYRTSAFHTMFAAVDIDPDNVSEQWYVSGYDFGMKYLRRLTIRWINAGLGIRGGAARDIAGQSGPADLFRLCQGCGQQQRPNTPRTRNHRAWCPYRASPTAPVRDVALTRTLTTQGVVVRLPAAMTIGDEFAHPSLAAALKLGLQQHFGGSPDHVDVALIQEPVAPGANGETRAALLLHDQVPGGTGYLAELTDHRRVYQLLWAAWKVVSSCECRDESRLACHRCLLPFAESRYAAQVSRETATRHLAMLLWGGTPPSADNDAVTAHSPGQVPQECTWEITGAASGPVGKESHLEQRTREALHEWLETTGFTLSTDPRPTGNVIRILRQGSPFKWTVYPQEPVHGCRPDFVLRCIDPSVPPTAIFVDGYTYHATGEINRIADDATKRNTLREAGFRVLSVHRGDLDLSRQRETPVWWWLPLSHRTTADNLPPTPISKACREGAMGLLREWCARETAAEGWGKLPMYCLENLFGLAASRKWTREKTMLPGLVAPERLAVTVLDGNSIEADVNPFATISGTADSAPESQVFAVTLTPHLVMVGAKSASRIWSVALVLDDRPEAVTAEGYEESWRMWLEVSNVLGEPGPSVTVTVTAYSAVAVKTAVIDGLDVASPMDATPQTGCQRAEYRAMYDEALDDTERELLVALDARLDIETPDQGIELPGGAMTTLLWEHEKLVIFTEPTQPDIADAEKQGYRVVEPTLDAVLAAFGKGK